MGPLRCEGSAGRFAGLCGWPQQALVAVHRAGLSEQLRRIAVWAIVAAVKPQAGSRVLEETLNHHEEVVEFICGKCDGKVSFADFNRQLVAFGRKDFVARVSKETKRRNLAAHPYRAHIADLAKAFACEMPVVGGGSVNFGSKEDEPVIVLRFVRSSRRPCRRRSCRMRHRLLLYGERGRGHLRGCGEDAQGRQGGRAYGG